MIDYINTVSHIHLRLHLPKKFIHLALTMYITQNIFKNFFLNNGVSWYIF